MTKVFFFLILSFWISQTASAAVLVGYWPFEEGSGSAVSDQSGQGNNGSTDASWVSGRVGQALSFDGTQNVTISNSLSLDSLPGGFTFSAWINPSSFPDYTTVFWKTDRNNRIHMLHFQVGDNQNLPVNEGRLYAAMNEEVSSGGFEGISAREVVLTDWSFVAWTYDEALFRFYLDGTEIFSAPFSESWVGNDIDLLIGYHPEVSSARFLGIIDEARIYRGALTQNEIIRDMNAGLVIPEPATFLLFSIGLFSLISVRRKKFKFFLLYR